MTSETPKWEPGKVILSHFTDAELDRMAASEKVKLVKTESKIIRAFCDEVNRQVLTTRESVSHYSAMRKILSEYEREAK